MGATRKSRLLVLLVAILLLSMLVGCRVAPPQNGSANNRQTEPPTSTTPSEKDEKSGSEEPSTKPSDTLFPAEIMELFKGHELSLRDNPLIGTYTTTSGCTMILMSGGRYSWQDSPQARVITGTYEIYEGTFGGGTGQNYILESSTGPLYTVFVTFDAGQNASEGTVQVFDYRSDNLYYVTDLLNNIWFEATKAT